MDQKEKYLYILMGIILLGFFLAGVGEQGFMPAITGFLDLQLAPARLIHDFTVKGGVGGALVNAAVVGAFGLLLVKWNGVLLAGPTLAAIFTLMGFALFGKTVLNITPIMLGVYGAAKFMGKPFKAYILFALFGTALGPLTTYVIFEIGIPQPGATLLGIIASFGAGFLLPSLAVSLLHLHQGYNLYNVGFTCGFLGLFLASLLAITKKLTPLTVIVAEGTNFTLKLLIPSLSLLLILAGFVFNRKESFTSLREIQKIPGRLPSDFVAMVSLGGTLLNMGILGLAGSAYVWLVGGSFNGPVLGGLLTLIGFSAFGKTLKNSWPIVLGVWISCLVFGKDPASTGPLLAALFGTTLAPLAGQFGPVVGFIAGFLHLFMVDRTGIWHGGLDLYNNGFAGGLTASLLIAILEWYNTQREGKKS
ncbi:MAG: DUF1576 domain-containing protein [Spirochaetales bacterium]